MVTKREATILAKGVLTPTCLREREDVMMMEMTSVGQSVVSDRCLLCMKQQSIIPSYLILQSSSGEGSTNRIWLEKRSKKATKTKGPKLLIHIDGIFVDQSIFTSDRDRFEICQKGQRDATNHNLAKRNAFIIKVINNSRPLEVIETSRDL